MTIKPDKRELRQNLEAVFRQMATAPDEVYSFEIGRTLAERLGYPSADLDRLPSEAVNSFAGVGYHIDLAAITTGDHVLDLGSGSGMDAFVAALHAGPTGRVTGIDMTGEQVTKARRLRDHGGFDTVTFKRSYIEELPFDNNTFDVVLSNKAITVSARKKQAFREARRVLTPGGRLAISDIVSNEALPEYITTNIDLWTAGIGGAMHVTAYVDILEAAGFEVIVLRENPQYEFRSNQARDVCLQYGLKSISLSARKR